MSLLLPLLTLLFICSAFLTNQFEGNMANPFFAYFFHVLLLISQYATGIIVGFFLLTLAFAMSLKLDKKIPFSKKYLYAAMQMLKFLLIGFFFSYILLFIIGLIHLNILSLTIHLNPKIFGIETDKKTIANNIKNNNYPPQIIATDNEQEKELLAIAMATSDPTSFYAKNVLTSIPSFFVFPIKKSDSGLLLIDNTLIITKIKPDEMEAINPILSYLIIKQYFPTRIIKSYPKITAMSATEYIAFRTDDASQKMKKVDIAIEKIDKNISSLSATIQNTKDEITYSENERIQMLANQNEEYKKCISTKNTNKISSQSGSLKTSCKNLLSQAREDANVQEKEVDALKKKLQVLEKTTTTYNAYKLYYRSLKEIVKNSKGNIPNELGFFAPQDSIKIMLNTTSPHAAADYLETLTHEYLHYASHVSQEKKLDSFFEEGLTEYFARQAIEKNLHATTNLSYPVQVAIITAMMKSITENELAEIYFTKDQIGLEKILDRVYGFGFYAANKFAFESLQYTSNPKEIIRLANGIMHKIEGPQITEKDLESNYSIL